MEIVCKGKQLFWFFQNGIAMYGGLGMEGHWYYFDNNPSYSSYITNKNYCKMVFSFATNSTIDTVICYDDMMSYGNFTICGWNDVINKIGEIGPDLLAFKCPFENVDPQVDMFLRNYTKFYALIDWNTYCQIIGDRKRQNMTICKFMMENKYISGIGNYLKSEILYACRIHPHMQLYRLTAENVWLLYNWSLEKISQSYLSGGLTHGTFLDPDMQKGTFSVYVYKRENEFDVNGFPIVRIKSNDGRSTYIVNQLQQC